MEALYYTFAGAALYLIADWLLQRIEVHLGKRLEHRTLVFFAIILVLALGSFAAIRNFTAT